MTDHYGVYGTFGDYQGYCTCGWEGHDILSHVSYELEVEELRDTVLRAISNWGPYAGDYVGDQTRRILDFLMKRGWKLPRG